MSANVKTSAEPLTNELARHEVLPTAQAVEIVRRLAREIAQRHDSDRLHLHISADTVSYDPDSSRCELLEPRDEAQSFGGADCDDEFCPPELQQARSVSLLVDIATTQHALQAAGLANVDPRRIDVYQLGALLCRMLTGQGVSAFLSRPRVAAKVSPELRDLIERALGHDSQHALRTAAEFLDALNAAMAGGNATAAETPVASKPDTSPSFVSTKQSDTSVGRPAPGASDDAALPFRKLGHYEIVGRLGRGGMGDVYKGYERRLDRYVAIKVLPAEFARQDEMVKRFNAEASAAAKLVHPNAVEIFFIGEDEVPVAADQPPSTLHFFAMRFVEGESLADLLARRQRLSVDETLAIIEQALAGLSAAHRLGMVHRDIKPGNILIDRERQRVLLADFGLVKSLQAAASMTASGVIVGTVDYMAPEQGRGASIDARADLYAIGVVMYQMLSGRLPFKADSPTGMIFQHVYETPPPLQDMAPNVPRRLAEIIAKLMAKSPDARYQNVDALLTDLRAFHQGHPLPSAASIAPTIERPRTVIIPAPRFIEEAVLPATLTQIATPSRWQRARQALRDFLLVPREEFVRQLQTTETQVDDAIAEYERRHASLASAIREAEAVLQELESQRDIWRRAITDAEQRASAACDDETARSALGEKVRGERVLAELTEQFDSQQSQLSDMRRKQSQVTATLERLRSQRDVLNARLKVARARIRVSGGQLRNGPKCHRIRRVRWPNAALLLLVLAALSGVIAMTADMTSRYVLGIAEPTAINPGSIAVRVVPRMNQTSTLNELFLNPPNVFAETLSGCDQNVISLAVSPQGTYVAAATGDKTVFVWDAQSGNLVTRVTGNLRRAQHIAFNSDESLLATGEAFGAVESTVKLWNPRNGELVGTLPGVTEFVSSLAFQPRGSLLAVSFLSASNPPILWNYETREEFARLASDRRNIGNLAFSPDGSLLSAMADREFLVWELAERKLLNSWSMSADATQSNSFPVFLPNSSHVLGVGAGSAWDARTGERVWQNGGVLPGTKSVAVSADGRWIAGTNGKWIAVVEARTGLPHALLTGHQTTKLAFSPKGDRLFSAGGAPFVARWNTRFPTLTARGPVEEIQAGPLLALARDKPLAFLNVGSDVGIWNYVTRTSFIRLKDSPRINPRRSSAAFSHDARYIALVNEQGQLSVWDNLAGDRIHHVRIPRIDNPAELPPPEFSEDSKHVFVATAEGLWRSEMGQISPNLLLEWPEDSEPKSLSPGAKYAVTLTRPSQMQVWDVATKRPILSAKHPYPNENFNSFIFTRDSQRLVGSDGHAGFFHWDLTRRELIGNSQLKLTTTGGFAFLPDQQHLLGLNATDTTTLRVIDVDRQEEVVALRGDSAPAAGLPVAKPTRIWITSDGRSAFVGAPDVDRLELWDLSPQLRLQEKQP